MIDSEHYWVEGVISLPAGVFQPYSGVKTSILVFKKGDGKETEEPNTERVWFYELTSDGYTLGADRSPQPLLPNDLWDALEKWKLRNDSSAVAADILTYWQPKIYRERWRMIDRDMVHLFPETHNKLDEVLAIDEIFLDIFSKDYEDRGELLNQAEDNTVAGVQEPLRLLLIQVISQLPFSKKTAFHPRDMSSEQLDQALSRLRSQLLNRSNGILERREGSGSVVEEHGRGLLTKALDTLREEVSKADVTTGKLWQELVSNTIWEEARSAKEVSEDAIRNILLSFARLDGYDIYLRSPEVYRQDNAITEAKSWIVPVRVWRKRLDWKSEDESLEGSHDERGNVRPEYIIAARDEKTGQIRPGFLAADCIEANEFNLSAARYRPITSVDVEADATTTANLIRELIEMEREIQTALEELLVMVEGRN